MKILYLVLAIVGGIVPYIFFVQHFGQFGIDLVQFIQALFVNGAAGGFTADLLISSLVFWIAMFSRHVAGNGPNPWLYVVINMTIGLSCALPAYLYANEKRKDDDQAPVQHNE